MRKTSRRVVALFLISFTLFTAGCWDRTEPENVTWVSALGVDTLPNGNFLFTFQMMVPKALGGAPAGGGVAQGAGSEGPSPFQVFSVEAADVVSALVVADAFVARHLDLKHIKAIILGREFAEGGVLPVLSPNTRFREFRRTAMIMIARETAREFLENLRPRVETDPAFWFELMAMWQADSALVPVKRVHDFIISIEQPGLGARAAFVAHRDQPRLADRPRDEEGRPPHPGGAVAGEVSRIGEVPVELTGAAVFKGDRMVGVLTALENRLITALRSELRETAWSVGDPQEQDKWLVLLMRLHRPTKVQVVRRGNQVHVEFNVAMEADLTSQRSTLNYTDPESISLLKRSVEQDLQELFQELLAKTLNEWSVDLYRLGDQLRASFATYPEFRSFNWTDRVHETTFRVQVGFQLRQTGLQTAPSVSE